MNLNNPGAFLIVGYFVLAVLLCSIKSRYIPGRAVALFRALLPSWRFFEDICEIPLLEFRVSRNGEDWSSWNRCIESPPREIKSLLFNAEGNLRLAYHSLVQQLEADLQEADDNHPELFLNSVSYLLTKNLVISRIRNDADFGEVIQFQFKVTNIMPGVIEKQTDDILISPICELPQ